MNHLMLNGENLFKIIFISMFFILTSYFLLKHFNERFFMTIAVTMCTFFSGVGIFTSFVDNSQYLFWFLLFMFFLILTLILVIKSELFILKADYENLFIKYQRLFVFLGLLALLLHLSKLIYPELRLSELLYFKKYYFSNDTFSLRLEQRSDSVYSFLSSISTIMLPFFFVLLYIIRKKPIFFILLTLFYPYISFVQTGYVGRTEILLWLVIIVTYLYYEKILKTKTLLILVLVFLVVLIPSFNFLFYYRQGIDISGLSFKETVNDFLRQESNSQNYLYVTELFSGHLSFLKMIENWVFKFIPFYPENNFPVLSYVFSTAVTGIEYGGHNYYILLPSAYGEAIMLLGKGASWIYAIFIALFSGIIFNFMKKVHFLRYWIIYFILNFGMAFRGGFQTFFSQYFYTTLGIFLVIFILRLKGKKRV